MEGQGGQRESDHLRDERGLSRSRGADDLQPVRRLVLLLVLLQLLVDLLIDLKRSS